MSEKTLASGKQIGTMLGRVVTELSAVDIPKDTAQLWIDRPEALKQRVAAFAIPPTVVQVISVRLSMTCRLGVLIDSWLGERFDVFAIDTVLDSSQSGFTLHPYTNIVITDSADIYYYLLTLPRLANVILIGETEPLVIGQFDNGVVLKNTHEALKWVGCHQLTKRSHALNKRITEFNAFVNSLSTK